MSQFGPPLLFIAQHYAYYTGCRRMYVRLHLRSAKSDVPQVLKLYRVSLSYLAFFFSSVWLVSVSDSFMSVLFNIV